MSEHSSQRKVERLEVDTTGLACPMTVILTARKVKDYLDARAAMPGRDGACELVVTVTATDPIAQIDLPAWAHMRGYEFISTRQMPSSSGVSGTQFVITISVPLTPDESH